MKNKEWLANLLLIAIHVIFLTAIVTRLPLWDFVIASEMCFIGFWIAVGSLGLLQRCILGILALVGVLFMDKADPSSLSTFPASTASILLTATSAVGFALLMMARALERQPILRERISLRDLACLVILASVVAYATRAMFAPDGYDVHWEIIVADLQWPIAAAISTAFVGFPSLYRAPASRRRAAIAATIGMAVTPISHIGANYLYGRAPMNGLVNSYFVTWTLCLIFFVALYPAEFLFNRTGRSLVQRVDAVE